MKRTLFAVLLLVLAGSVAIGGCAQAQPTPVKPTPTAVAPGSGAPIPGQRVITEARVKPVRSAELTFSSSGTVAQVLVTDGQSVKAGEPLARLDSRRQAAAVSQAEAALARAQATRARAQATLASSQAAQAQLKPGGRTQEIAVARAALQTAEAELARLLSGADPAQLAAAQAGVDKAARAVQQAQFAYDNSGNGRAEALKLEQATIDYQAAKAQYELLAQLPRPVDVAVARAAVAQAQVALDQSSAGGTPEAVKAADAAAVAAEAELAGSTADVAAAEAALAQAKAALAETELKAPFDGVAVSVNVKAGEAAPAAGVAVRFADLSAWLVETTDLTELSVGRVAEGAPAVLTFDAIPGLELTGKVTKIKPYGEIRQGDIVYAVLISLDKQDSRIRWNMTAKAAIEVR